jgi:PTH1 family peptidyl-tRNA hydrolase
MKLIVGLGNPGREYEGTRHNVGFDVVEAFARKFRMAWTGHEKDARTGRGRVAGDAVMVARPLTFMNLSGKAVGGLVRAHLEGPSDLLVVYDDIDLPLGRLRIRENGSAGTHNGMRSIVEELATERFARLRFGIGAASRSDRPLSDFVLDRFDQEEQAIVEREVVRAVDALVLFVRGELRRAMNQFNKDPIALDGEERTTG